MKAVWFIIAGISLVIGFAAFPGIKTALDATSTTGFDDLTKAAIKMLPFALIGFIFYAGYLITHRNK
jgi:hypothetical protein